MRIGSSEYPSAASAVSSTNSQKQMEYGELCIRNPHVRLEDGRNEKRRFAGKFQSSLFVLIPACARRTRNVQKKKHQHFRIHLFSDNLIEIPNTSTSRHLFVSEVVCQEWGVWGSTAAAALLGLQSSKVYRNSFTLSPDNSTVSELRLWECVGSPSASTIRAHFTIKAECWMMLLCAMTDTMNNLEYCSSAQIHHTLEHFSAQRWYD